MTLPAARRRTLRDYSEPRIRQIVFNIGVGLPDHLEIANLARQISADYHGRFLIEMLQNASDQAGKAGLEDSVASITRTASAVYVTNQGVPFGTKGLEMITQLGLSDKSPDESIGNKGIGFKSIVQVATGAEVYSAVSADVSFRQPGGLRFEVKMRPLDDDTMADLRSVVEEVIADVSAETLAALGDDPVSRVTAEAKKSAPFRFPLSVSDVDLQERLADAELPDALVASAQTLVCIPLIDAPEAQAVVDTAMKELKELGGSTLLFLPAVSRLIVRDLTAATTFTLSRRALETSTGETGAIYAREATASEEGGEATTQVWRTLGRTLGSTEPERELIRAAVRDLPGAGWDEVETARVVVALPEDAPGLVAGTPLPGEGLFSIGLPTRMRTGSPFWVDARFHGTISRTEIDLEQTPYNGLLFDEAKALVGQLLDLLKLSKTIKTRRLVTQALTVTPGPLGEWMRVPGGISETDVVLATDGATFLRPNDLALPARENTPMLFALSRDAELQKTYGFVVAEIPLLNHARDLLDELTGTAPALVDARFLERVNGVSLLEQGARAKRQAGPAFWSELFTWLLDRFQYEQLADQQILPVGEDELLAPSANVFYSRSAADDDEDGVGSIPTQIVTALRLLDETALPMRARDGRNLTPLARRLAPDGGRGLVRVPRLVGLINDAVAPRIRQSVAAGDHAAALQLLQQALEWLRLLNDARLTEVRRSDIVVPCLGDEGWRWVPSNEAYFGTGWLDADVEHLLLEAYEGRRQMLEGWADLHAETASEHDRAWWLEGLRRLGVNDSPRVLRFSSRSGELTSRSRTDLSLAEWSCPFGGEVHPYWVTYLTGLALTCIPVQRTGRYSVRDMTWIDGLEVEAARSAVTKLMFLTSRRYLDVSEARLERTVARDSAQDVESLWVYTLRTADWAVIPTSQGPKAPGQSWLLAADQHRRASDTYKALATVVAPYDLAGSLLQQIGVEPLWDASADRLVALLQEIAGGMNSGGAEEQEANASLVPELYQRLADACRDDAAPSISEIVRAPVPVFVGRRLVALDLTSRVVYVNDDEIRTQFLEARDDIALLPLSSRAAQVGFVGRLRALLGDERVVYASEAPIDPQFVPNAGPVTTVLEYLASLEARVPRDLALVYAYDRHQDAPPGSVGFREAWRLLTDTLIRRGAFPPGFQSRYFFDRHADGAPTLDVSAELDEFEVIRALWVVLGKDSRNPLSAYASALQADRADGHFAEGGIGVAQIKEVEAALGLSSPDRLTDWQDLFYAVWRSRYLRQGVTAFLAELSQQRSIADLARFLNVDAQLLFNLEQRAGDVEVIALLEAGGASVEEWQLARRNFDKDPFVFETVRARFTASRDQLAWGLASAVVHLPSVALDAARKAIEVILATAPSEDSLTRWDSADDLARELTTAAITAFRDSGSESALPLIGRVERLRDEKASLDALIPRDATEREIREYAEISASVREERAETVFSDVTKLATPLAARLGEALDHALLRQNERVSSLISGWWANRFGVLETLHRAIRQSGATKTADALSDAGVFKDPPDWRRFWSALHLGPFPAETASEPDKNVVIGGVPRSAGDVFADLLKGPAGELGAMLSDAANPEFDFAPLRVAPRDDATPPVPRRPKGGPPVRTSTPPRRESDVVRSLNGLMGEVFIFEQLRASLGLDYLGWVSLNRVAYGFPNTGASDDFGYDFLCEDTDGRLCGVPRSLCHVEVKSSGGPARDTFEMSSAEWRDAEECHTDGTARYVILRVADVRDKPHIVDCLLDPVALWRQGKLRFSHEGLLIRIAPPTVEGQAVAADSSTPSEP